MECELVLKILRQNQAEIKSFGVKSLALFGSVARGDARPDSDVDLLVEFDRPVGLFGLVALQQRVGYHSPGFATIGGSPGATSALKISTR